VVSELVIFVNEMKTMNDPRWEESFTKGKILEEGLFGNYKTVLLTISEPIGIFDYPYRLFFFKENTPTPILILSLEVGRMFGTCALGAHNESAHMNFGDAEINMTAEDFKVWAFSTAQKIL